MRFAKIRKLVLLGVLMLICFAAGSYATDGIKEVKAFLREDFKIILDGRTIILENSVLIHDNYSYLPLREIGLLLNVNVEWSDKDRSVILTSPTVVETPIPTPDGSASGNTSGSNTSGDAQYPAEIQFANVINYKITLDSKVYYVLANEQNSTIYFRKSDVDMMNLDLSGLKTVKEKYTSELYYPANELSLQLKNPGKFEVSTDVIIHETNAEKLKALKAYLPSSSSFEQAYYIRALPEDNKYEILFLSADKRFYVYIMKLVANFNGTYYTGTYTKDYLYD